MAAPTFPVPPGVTVGAGVNSIVGQLNANTSSWPSVSLDVVAGNVVYFVLSTIDAAGNLVALPPSHIVPLASGIVFVRIPGKPTESQFTGTAVTTKTVSFGAILSQSSLGVVAQVWQYLPS